MMDNGADESPMLVKTMNFVKNVNPLHFEDIFYAKCMVIGLDVTFIICF